MNWFKKRLDRLFTKDEIEEYEKPIEEKKIYENNNLHNKPKFRFPLISDEERNRILNKELPYTAVDHKEEIEDQIPLYMRDRWREQRENTIVHKAERKEPVRQVEPLSIKELEQPTVVRKKRFEPTKIPSPVYGFNSRQVEKITKNEIASTKVTELKIEDQNDRDKEIDREIIESVTLPQWDIENDIIKEEIIERNTIPIQTIEASPVLIEPNSISELVEPIIIEQSIDVEKEEVEIEKNTIEIEEQRVELEIESKEIVEENISESIEEIVEVDVGKSIEEIVDEDKNVSTEAIVVQAIEKESIKVQTEPVEKKKSETLPFNVLMLKSDKKPLQSNPFLKAELAVKQSVKQVEPPNEILKEDPKKSEQAIPTYNTDNKQLYELPSLDFLTPPEQKAEDREWMNMQAAKLEEALSYFQVQSTVINSVQGPTVTQFELTVGHGTKVSKIRNLADDLKLALAARDIRIQAPILGKSSIGIEIPNRVARPVRISEVIGSEEFQQSTSPLEAALGLDLTGKPTTIDLRKMPHGLIAGATGSGKSVSINSILISLLYKSTPEDLRLLLIDPKVVELAPFNHIPHLISPVITDVKAANAALKWAVEEMERRYQLFAHAGVRDLSRYNALAIESRQFSQKLPYVLIVIDELADLMMMAPAEVEESISRIAQKARACGIHLIIATQRPSVDVITGLIKANIPTRVAFSVSSQIDSRTIIDIVGAERLLGKGDMLYLGNGMSAPSRIQGTYVSDDEIERVVEHVRSQGDPDYFFEQEELIRKTEMIEEKDELFEEACRFILETGNASTSLLQRKFHIGYNRAARLIDLLEQNGFISEQKGSKPRDVFLTEQELNNILDLDGK